MISRKSKDSLATLVMYSSLVFINLLALIIIIVLFIKSIPVLSKDSLFNMITSTAWAPLKGKFGFLPFIVGTFEVTALSMIIAVPICILSSIYLAEYAHKKVREIIRPIIDLLAGIPSVIYGLFAVLVIVPIVRQLGTILSIETTGYTLLAGAIILAIMVFPIIISVSTEVLLAVPVEARETSLALGTTKWEMVKKVVLRMSITGIIAAIVLGFSRAIGETMAVMMVVGNVAIIPKSLFDPAYPLTALIANNYGEMMSIPLYDSALLFAALLLMAMVAVFNLSAHYTLKKIRRGLR